MATPRTPDKSGQVLTADPSDVAAVNEHLDKLEEILPSPKKPRRKGRDEPPPPRSQLAIRVDGKLLVSVEDTEGCDLRGRELVTFAVLRDDEVAFTRKQLGGAFCEVAARIIGKLPRFK